MPAPFQGGCLCRAVRYEVTAEPLAVMNCHCRDCQYASGGGYTTAVVVPRTAFRLLKGTPRTFATTGDNGKSVIRHFCAICGTPLFGQPPNQAIWVVKAATLDDPSWLTMSGALYVKSAQPWAHIDHTLPVFEAMPPVKG
jgi:hypothetical protein